VAVRDKPIKAFASYLGQVFLVKVLASEGNRYAFYRRTYITEGLQNLLVGALERFSSGAGDLVIELQIKIVMSPSQHICSKQTAESLERFVNAGGTLILGPRSGVKDEHNAVAEAFLPGHLRGLAGCSVEDYDAFSTIPGFTMQVKDGNGREYEALGLAEILVPEANGRSILSYTKRYYAGRSAAVEQHYGSGRCLYLGTVLGEEGLEALLSRILDETGISYQKQLPPALEVASRERDGQSYRFYLNHGTAQVSLAPIRPGTDLLSGHTVSGEMKIPGLDLMIVKEH
jgi:beta-galactosidase